MPLSGLSIVWLVMFGETPEFLCSMDCTLRVSHALLFTNEFLKQFQLLFPRNFCWKLVFLAAFYYNFDKKNNS